MLITLPDKSVARLDRKTLQFNSVDSSRVASTDTASVTDTPFGINCKMLASMMSDPRWKFGDCFRRISDHPRYSPRRSVHEFDVSFLTSIYKFGGTYQGGTFSSSTTQWGFLDGGIISHSGYGWGSHSWTVVEGIEALRALCLFFGIRQPQRVKGETEKRPLANLLEEMTSVPLQDRRRRLWNLPEPLDHNAQQGGAPDVFGAGDL
jgi:hypothetical protein